MGSCDGALCCVGFSVGLLGSGYLLGIGGCNVSPLSTMYFTILFTLLSMYLILMLILFIYESIF